MDPEYPPPVQPGDDAAGAALLVGMTDNATLMAYMRRVGSLQDLEEVDLSDWSAYPDRACDPDRPIAELGDLALFLGGDDTSFTGNLLRLIEKANFSPANLNRLAYGFPRETSAWIMWHTLIHGGPPTAVRLRDLLELAHVPLKGRRHARSDG